MLAMSQQRQSTVKVVSVELVHLKKKHSDCTLCTNKENLRESLQHMCQGFLPKCAPDSATPKRGIDLQWSRLAMVFFNQTYENI